jgi:hypothetical protein
MVTIRPREDWQDPNQPVVGPSINLGSIELVPAHYTAASNIPGDIPAYLRSIQNDYTVNRGYSIGYNFAVDQSGEAWELRGLDIKCAANKDMNEVTVAVLCLVDGADAMNDAMVATFQEIGALVEGTVGRQLLVVGHRDIGSTSCPGDGIYGQVQAGLLEPNDSPDPVPPTPQEDEMATVILAVEGRNAQFIGQGPLLADGSVHNLFVTWFGPGPDSDFLNDHRGAPDTRVQATLASTLKRDIIFLGNPEEIQDSTGGWSAADFYRVIRS